MEQCILGDIFSLAFTIRMFTKTETNRKGKSYKKCLSSNRNSRAVLPGSLRAAYSVLRPTGASPDQLTSSSNACCTVQKTQNTPHQLTRSLNAVQICSAKQQNATCSTISTFHNYNLLLNKFNSSSTAIPNTFKMKYIFKKQSAQHSWCSIWASVAVGHNECSCKVVCGEAKHTLLGGKKKVMHQTQLPHPPQQGLNFPAGNYMYKKNNFEISKQPMRISMIFITGTFAMVQITDTRVAFSS